MKKVDGDFRSNILSIKENVPKNMIKLHFQRQEVRVEISETCLSSNEN